MEPLFHLMCPSTYHSAKSQQFMDSIYEHLSMVALYQLLYQIYVQCCLTATIKSITCIKLPATKELVNVLNFWLPLVPGGETAGGLGRFGMSMSVADLFTIQIQLNFKNSAWIAAYLFSWDEAQMMECERQKLLWLRYYSESKHFFGVGLTMIMSINRIINMRLPMQSYIFIY